MVWRRRMTLLLLLTGVFVSYRNTIQNRNYGFIASRKTVKTLSDEKGIIKDMGSQSDPLYIITYTAHNTSLFPYNLPNHFQVDGKRIVFSGNIKEMHLMEDEHGVYFEISRINSFP